MSTPLEHTTRVSLRWRDMDMLGHLNQSVYHELLEEARAGLITEVVQRVAAGGEEIVHGTFVLARVELDYRSEVRRDHGSVDIAVRVARIGTSSITLEHDIRLPDGTVAASGVTILVGWDPVARGKRTLSDAERAALGA